MKYKQIPGYPNYKISDKGTVINTKFKRELKPSKTSKGYHIIGLCNMGVHQTFSVHRLVALTYLVDVIPENMTINHIDGNKTNNHYSNLEIVTYSKNVEHALVHGLFKTKLSFDQVREIRKSYIPFKVTYKILAQKYGVSQSMIKRILNGQHYRFVL